MKFNLLEIAKRSDLNSHHMKGAVFENFVITEMMKNTFNNSIRPNFSFWRDKTSHEVDLIKQKELEMKTCIEIKSSKTLNTAHCKGLNYIKKINPSVKNQILIYAGEDERKLQGVQFINWKHLSKI